MRKDFLIDEYQVVEARLAGADAVLLIAEILDDEALVSLRERAAGLGMAALVEFHDPANLPRVLDSGADLVGINNRDLKQLRHRHRAHAAAPRPGPARRRAGQRERHPHPAPTSSGSRPPASRRSWSANR